MHENVVWLKFTQVHNETNKNEQLFIYYVNYFCISCPVYLEFL